MKARSKELLDRAVAATVAAIEIYNKPDFLYRKARSTQDSQEWPDAAAFPIPEEVAA